MTPAEAAQLADLAVSAAEAAAEVALERRRSGLLVGTKSTPTDLVTDADRAAEATLVDQLLTARPDDGVLGEEGTAHEGRSGRTWVVDPVDGTYNFVAGLDWWCSAIALTDGDRLVLGAVHHPATGRTFVGGPDLPTTVDGRPLGPLADRPLATSCLTTYLHPPFYAGEVGAAFVRMAGGAATLRMLGSGSMDAVAVAEGRLHVLCQHSVPPWDELPGAALVLGVGGATDRVDAAGVTWHVAGAPTAVADVARSLVQTTG